MTQQRFHAITTQTVLAIAMINLPNKQALALGNDGTVYSWRGYMGLWFATANTKPDWFDLGLRAMAETNGKAQVRNGKFKIRTPVRVR